LNTVNFQNVDCKASLYKVTLFVMSQLSQIGAIYCMKEVDFNSSALSSIYTYFLLLLLCFHAFVWQKLLALVPISVVYPATALLFPVILGLGWVVYDEAIAWRDLISVALIMCGVYMLLRREECN